MNDLFQQQLNNLISRTTNLDDMKSCFIFILYNIKDVAIQGSKLRYMKNRLKQSIRATFKIIVCKYYLNTKN